MKKPFALIVTDTSPLFTLVLAGALDTLLRPALIERQRRAGEHAETGSRFRDQLARRADK